MSDPTISIELPGQPSTDDTIALHEQFCSAQNSHVSIDAAQVKIVTSLEAQVLLGAKAQWVADDLGFSITSPSDGFITGLLSLGIDLQQLDEKAVQ